MADHRADFADFVRARRPALVRTAYLLCGDAHLAEDLVQGALIKAVARWKRIGNDPEPWLRTVMVNDHISGWRKRRREQLWAQAPDKPEDSPDSDGRLSLASALAMLAPKQCAVIVLRYYEDLTEAETARILGVSVGTVKSQHSDALNRLRSAVPGVDAERPATEPLAGRSE